MVLRFPSHSADGLGRTDMLKDSTEARDRIGDFLTHVYNQKLPHSTLEYLTPMEFQ